jgi:hypothetical protein
MADHTAAERQRRHRAHRRGDHRQCLATTCPDAAQTAPPVTAGDLQRGPDPDPIDHEPTRGRRGAKLWAAWSDDLPPGHLILLDEACRMADRLDRLDELLGQRKSWARFETDDGGRVVVVVDSVLAESRQLATALKALLLEVAKVAPKHVPKGKPAAVAEPPARKGAGLGDLVDFAAAARSRQTAH